MSRRLRRDLSIAHAGPASKSLFSRCRNLPTGQGRGFRRPSQPNPPVQPRRAGLLLTTPGRRSSPDRVARQEAARTQTNGPVGRDAVAGMAAPWRRPTRRQGTPGVRSRAPAGPAAPPLGIGGAGTRRRPCRSGQEPLPGGRRSRPRTALGVHAGMQPLPTEDQAQGCRLPTQARSTGARDGRVRVSRRVLLPSLYGAVPVATSRQTHATRCRPAERHCRADARPVAMLVASLGLGLQCSGRSAHLQRVPGSGITLRHRPRPRPSPADLRHASRLHPHRRDPRSYRFDGGHSR